MPVVRGSAHHLSALTDHQVIKMRKQYATGQRSYTQLAKAFNVDKSTIGRIINGQTWRHLPVLPAPDFEWRA